VLSELREALVDYLDLRRSLGFKLRWADQRLGNFLDFLEQAASPVITTGLATAWATQPKRAKPKWWAKRLELVRGFARYVQTLDPRTEVPSPGLLPQVVVKRPPYLYSEEDVRALLDTACQLKHPFRALTYATLLGLLAATGMRVGEAIALDREDVDWEEATLTVRNTKFGKSREVALHPTLLRALARYAQDRDRAFPRRAICAFFVSLANQRLIYQNVHFTFFQLVDRAGLAGRSPRRPRIHDFRHSFACWTLRDWHAAGLDVERHLPLLSTYLGHVSPATTYWYLTGAPELLCVAAQRLQKQLGELP
jgi:integrase